MNCLKRGLCFSNGTKKTCPYCYQQLSWHALSRHIRDMHKAKSDLVTCKYCLKTFRNKNSLGCHIWRFHKRGKELIGATAAMAGVTGGLMKADHLTGVSGGLVKAEPSLDS